MHRKSALLELPFVAQQLTGAEPPAEPPVLSVAELDRRLRRVVEGATEDARVEGEVSGLKVVPSGHAYFVLKDGREDAMLDCVVYKAASGRARKVLADGARVVLTGKATLYVPRGKLQFVAEDARLAGRGALLEALEELKRQLAAEGLFSPERKRKLPEEPATIGVVTSRSGAAIHDIVKVAFRRGSVRILLAPALVQGAGAPAQICAALSLLDATPGVDVVILGRGGGSADDLSAFNDESVVRRVAAMRVPVVSAVGHEVDVTLTDLAADARASTPSQAAELLVPDAAARGAELRHVSTRMVRALSHLLLRRRRDVERLRGALESPRELLAERQQGVDEALSRLAAASRRLLAERRDGVHRLERRLSSRHPRAVIAEARGALSPLEVRAEAAMVRAVELRRERLVQLAGRLDALSPLRVLGRGYAIALGPSGRALRDAREASAGDALVVRLEKGELDVSVVASRPAGNDPSGRSSA